MHHDSPDHSQGIDGDVSLATSDLFPSIIASFHTAFGSANRLAIDNGNARRGFLSHLLTNSTTERLVDGMPDAVSTPTPEDRVNGLPVGKLVGQVSPLATVRCGTRSRQNQPSIQRRATHLSGFGNSFSITSH